MPCVAMIELTWIVVGVVLGGPAGLGTVMVAVFIGPAVARGYRMVDTITARSHRRLATTNQAIIARELQSASAARSHFQKTIETLITKPVRRWEVVLGKWLEYLQDKNHVFRREAPVSV